MRQAFFLLLAVAGFAIATPDEDWNAVVALDAGPGAKPKNLQEARALAKSHLQQQEKLVSEFLEKNPSDLRSHEARMRLASLLAAIGKMDSRQSQVDESMRLLQALDADPAWTANQTLDILLHHAVLWAREEFVALSSVAGKRPASVAFSAEPDTVRCLLCDRKHSMNKCLGVSNSIAKA